MSDMVAPGIGRMWGLVRPKNKRQKRRESILARGTNDQLLSMKVYDLGTYAAPWFVAAKAEKRCAAVLAERERGAAAVAVDEVADEDEDIESVSDDEDEL